MQNLTEFLFIRHLKDICEVKLNMARLGIDEGREVSEENEKDMILLSLFSMMFSSHIDIWINVGNSNSHMNQKVRGDAVKC